MPIYEYECRNGHHTEEYMRIADRQEKIPCPVCDEVSFFCISARQYARTFKPYVETGFDGTPIEVTTKDQREALCKKHHLTYDTYKYRGKIKKSSPVDDVTFDQVKRAIDRGKLDDGTPLEKPIKLKKDDSLTRKQRNI